MSEPIELIEDVKNNVLSLEEAIKIKDTECRDLKGKVAMYEYELNMAKENLRACAATISKVRTKAFRQGRLDIVQIIDSCSPMHVPDTGGVGEGNSPPTTKDKKEK